jgi:uncharacterized protein
MQRRTLGKTGLEVSILGVGGYHIGKDHDIAFGTKLIRTAIDEGVNFMDNAWCYNQGVSETVMGYALRDGYRDRVVLMTKNHGRDGVTFDSHLEDSLRRLQTDRIDVVQFHEMITEGDPQKIYAGGALEAATKAREQGKIRFIGFTGHRWPYLFTQMLDGGFEWDTAQLPANLLDYHYRSFSATVMPQLVEKNIGIIGMKSLAGDGKSMFAAGVSASEAMRYSMSLPIHTLISGMDTVELIRENCALARSFEAMADDEREALLARVATHATDGTLEAYKTD